MKLEWTEPSILDLENIREYIARDSEHYAARFIARILEVAETLPHHPLIGRVVPESDNDAIRELLFQNYRIIYRAEPERIVILAVIHGSRDLGGLEPKPWEVA